MAAKSSKSYRIRESARAKHVSIRVSHLGEVEVVVPKGFDRRKLPEILEKRKDWIAKTTQHIVAERQSIAPSAASEGAGTMPKALCLQAIGEDWTVQYEAKEGGLILPIAKNHQIIVATPDSAQVGYRLLRHWLTRKAELHLIPWLRHLSQELDLPFNRAAVRGQKTLWASCSGKKNISLNYKLLFLPPHLVRYVLIHELCHTIHLNHSPKYWALVAEKEPDYKQLDTDLNRAWVYVPEWVERSLD